MPKLKWDQASEKLYETGVDNVVLYKQDDTGAYPVGVAWNGVTAVNEKPSGAEATAKYANNKKYLNLVSKEEFGCTLEAYTSPEEFDECDGSAELAPGISIGQQRRRTFALTYRTLVGNDIDGDTHGYKIHFVWGCLAKPSERSHSTVNESPEASSLSWEITTTPVDVEDFQPTAHMWIDTTRLTEAQLAKLDDMLDLVYGTDGAPGTTAKMPTPEEVVSVMAVV